MPVLRRVSPTSAEFRRIAPIDGSVRLVSTNISTATWQNVNYPTDGNTLASDWEASPETPVKYRSVSTSTLKFNIDVANKSITIALD